MILIIAHRHMPNSIYHGKPIAFCSSELFIEPGQKDNCYINRICVQESFEFVMTRVREQLKRLRE